MLETPMDVAIARLSSKQLQVAKRCCLCSIKLIWYRRRMLASGRELCAVSMPPCFSRPGHRPRTKIWPQVQPCIKSH